MAEDITSLFTHIGSGVVGGLIVLFFNHLLTKRRDLDKEQRARDEAADKERRAAEAALHLTDTERDLFQKCIEPEGWEKGRLWIMRADSVGVWIRAGTHDYLHQEDASIQSRYMDAFESLFARGYFRKEGGTLFILTGHGFKRAKEA